MNPAVAIGPTVPATYGGPTAGGDAGIADGEDCGSDHGESRRCGGEAAPAESCSETQGERPAARGLPPASRSVRRAASNQLIEALFPKVLDVLIDQLR